MSQNVDARGLSCPQPVLMALEQMNQQSSGEFVVLVDSETSRENVSRAAEDRGWAVKDIQTRAEEIEILLQKS